MLLLINWLTVAAVQLVPPVPSRVLGVSVYLISEYHYQDIVPGYMQMPFCMSSMALCNTFLIRIHP